jgi:hypothetical protein
MEPRNRFLGSLNVYIYGLFSIVWRNYQWSEPIFENLLGNYGIDSQPGGAVPDNPI